MRKKDSVKTSYFTKLMITECTHEVDAKGYYNGTFKAIAADTGYLPRPEFISPNAESQPAKVISNSDPLNQGRVQVRFDWQLHDTTDWIRVMTPDGGGSDKVSKNRGFMAIPEVGDQVMVDFIHDNPDRPFVLGGMFHGKVGGGGGAGNNVKSFSGKSGNIICLNDGAGIEIKDKNGNHVTLSGTGDLTTGISADYKEIIGGNQNTSITGNHDIKVDASSATTVDNQFSVNVGGCQSYLSLGKSGNIELTSEATIKLTVGSNSIEISKTAINIKGLEINIEAGAAKAKFKGITTITGTQVDIN